jgi:hypothetical protein
MTNWAGVSIACGLLTLGAAMFGWGVAIIGVVCLLAYRSKR